MSSPTSHYAVILAGGEGTRFAPLSTPEKPKQFLSILHSNRSMIQQTADRLEGLVTAERLLVSTNSRYVPLVSGQLPQLKTTAIVGEPIKKNTAPAIALLSHLVLKTDPDAVLLFLPSDHFIKNQKRMQEIFRLALDHAHTHDDIVVFGIPPTFASSDYGYIFCEEKAVSAVPVSRFVEKPDVTRAKAYLADGRYFWNSGMFVWKASVLLDAVARHLPEMHQLLHKVKLDAQGGLEAAGVKAFFEAVESISIDYGVLEKASNVVMFPFDAGWSDVGTWQGLSALVQAEGLNIPPEVKAHLASLRF